MSRRGAGRFSMFAEEGGNFGSLPPPRSRTQHGGARASMDLDQLRSDLHRRCDADGELGDFFSDSRLRFQQLLDGGKAGARRPSLDDRFAQLMGSTGPGPGMTPVEAGQTGVVTAGDAVEPSSLLARPRPTLMGSRSPLLAERSPLLAERSLLGGRSAGLLSQKPLSSRLNGGITTRTAAGGVVNSASSSAVVNSSSSSSSSCAVASSSSSVVNSSAAVSKSSSSNEILSSSSAVLGSEGDRAVVAAGSDGVSPLPNVTSKRQKTFQQSRTASNTTFSQSMDGGPAQSNVVRHCEQQETHATTENGATSVAQQRQQQHESATLTEHNGETRLEAERAELAQKMTAHTGLDGVTEVQEEMEARGAVRQATFEQDEHGAVKPVTSSGQDFEARAQLDYTHEAGEGGSGQFKINSGPAAAGGGAGGASGRPPPLWRFSAFGPLIQPPSGKIRGQVSMQTSHSMFSCQAGALPRYTGAQYSFEDTFEVSESESDDDEFYLPPAARRQQLHWRDKPALCYDSGQVADHDAASEAAPSEAPSEALGERDAELGDDVAQAEEEARRRRERLHKIAQELMLTERKYVQELHLIDQIFHFRVDQENRAHHMFSNEITAQMFSNVKSIYQFHKDHMLPQLEKRLDDWENDPRIGDVMKTCAPFLKMYTEFVKNFDNAMNLINDFAAKSSRFAAIMNEIHEMDECGNLPLQHHMIVPIQRVPRYELLLKDYLKRLPEGSPDYDDTKKALELVTHAATHSNETMKRVDKFKQLLEIQENISGGPDLVSPTRQLIKQGKISKISARGGDHQERYLFLFSDLLLLCSPRLINHRIISGPAYRLRAKFAIEGLEVLEGDNLETGNTFYVHGSQKNVELYTQTADEKAEWLEALCSVVTSFYQRRASLKAEPQGFDELGRKKPVMLRQEGVSRCMNCDSQFGMMRRKHGCHACGIVVCSKCSPNKLPLPCEQNKPGRVCNRCFKILIERVGGGQSAEAGDAVTPAAAAARRTSVLDVSYTRGKGVFDVPATSDCLLSGYLQLRVRKAWSRRWFCLRGDFVLYSYPSCEAAQALTATPVPGFSVNWGGAGGKPEPGVADKERERTLKLSHARKSYLFLGENKEDVARWVAALQKASRAEALPQTPSEV